MKRSPSISVSPETRALVIETWEFRARAERESELRFRRLSHELAQVGALKVVVDLASRGAYDEHRHSQLCAAMCHLYGGDARPKGKTHDHRATSAGLGKRESVLYEVVSFACIAETINAQLLGTLLRSTTSERMVKVIRRLMKDEVQHSRFGWAHLAAERKAGHGDFLSGLFPQMLAGSVEPSLFDSAPEPVGAEALAHGELPRLDRVEIFRSALLEVIFPGFDTFGLNTAPARQWLEKRLAA